MSETRDKRRKSDLDLFVLALIGEGVSTPYALQKEAGLSQGATVPAIQRMLDAGLIRQAKPGARGRTDSRITAAGKKVLKDGWQALINEGPSADLDVNLRVALLAISQGNAFSLAAEWLKRSAAKLHAMGQAASPDNESVSAVPLANLYRELRSVSVRSLLEGQASAATMIADRLPRELPARRAKARDSSPQRPSSRRDKRLK